MAAVRNRRAYRAASDPPVRCAPLTHDARVETVATNVGTRTHPHIPASGHSGITIGRRVVMVDGQEAETIDHVGGSFDRSRFVVTIGRQTFAFLVGGGRVGYD